MLRDLGSRDFEFVECVREIRKRLLEIAGDGHGNYEAILLQGSGTFSIESVVGSTVPQDRKLLVIVNGAYGRRIAQMARVLKIDTVELTCEENQLPSVEGVEQALASDPAIGYVAVVHCETTTGILNPIDQIGVAAKYAGCTYFVDAMSSFGAVPIDLDSAQIDFLVSSANKCIEGVPGFGFVIVRRDALVASEGRARSLSLDLVAQWKGLESNGQFRFTPPTHALLAFHQALIELELEGGVVGRASRYRRNYETLVHGMREFGFTEYLPVDIQGSIITSFRFPADPKFDFERFYEALNERGYVIYPGKVSNADCFRIGNIGRIFESDVKDLLGAIRTVVAEMGFDPSA